MPQADILQLHHKDVHADADLQRTARSAGARRARGLVCGLVCGLVRGLSRSSAESRGSPSSLSDDFGYRGLVSPPWICDSISSSSPECFGRSLQPNVPPASRSSASSLSSAAGFSCATGELLARRSFSTGELPARRSSPWSRSFFDFFSFLSFFDFLRFDDSSFDDSSFDFL